MSAHRITTLSAKLAQYSSQPVPSGRALYYGAIGAKYPAHQVRTIWHFMDEDLPTIAAAYSLAPKAEAKPARKASAAPVCAAA